MNVCIEQQCHGYKNGHQLLTGSIRLPRGDQDIVDRLSDISGPLRPGETFAPYLTAYPLPSGSSYVLAKTWLDLNAPRAGCVLTRSLLIPMETWERLEHPASLAELLAPVDRQEALVKSISFAPHSINLPGCASKRCAALVEALFLESRKPIVLFDEEDSVLIAERLLSSFWPAMRRMFSLCTLALSPRSISGRSFDLVFAPRSARSRFSQWDGRIIESSFNAEAPSRHPWTAITVKHIFEDNPPSLLSLDALGILRLDEHADESSLRLALLWNELLEKSESSPTAILGLLDILNSRGRSSSEDLLPFVPLVARGVDLAKKSMSSLDALRLLVTLSGKFPSGQPPIDVLSILREGLSDIASKDPKAAISLLQDQGLGKQTHAPIVTVGIGDGLATLRDAAETLQLASLLQAEDQLRLLAYSRSWAETIIRATESVTPDLWTKMLANALQYPDGDLQEKSRRNVVPLLRTPAHASLLGALLRDSDNEVLISVAEQIRDNTHFAVADFDEPLRHAARGAEGISGLRKVILAGDPNQESDRFLLATLSSSASDLDWLLRDGDISDERRFALLNSVLSKTSDRDIQSLVQDEFLSERIEKALAEDLPAAAVQLARVLISGNVPVPRLLRNGCLVLSLVDSSLKSELALRMLTLGLSSAGNSENGALEGLVAESKSLLDSHRLVALAVPRNASPQRVNDNIDIFDRATPDVRTGILVEIEELSDRLISRRYDAIPADLARSWAHLLQDSGQVNQRAQTKAAGSVLSYAFEHRTHPVSPLVVVAFPIVYAQLRAGNEAPGLLSFFFTDWDRCKTARKDIIQAFLNSNWPAIDLIKAVEPTGDMNQVLRRLVGERDGESFLARLNQEVHGLPVRERKRIEKVIADALRDDDAMRFLGSE